MRRRPPDVSGLDGRGSPRAREFPEFPVAVSLLGLLTPEEALRQLEMRVAVLEDEVARIDSQFGRAAAEGLPRLFLLETEYQRATREAELEWSARSSKTCVQVDSRGARSGSVSSPNSPPQRRRRGTGYDLSEMRSVGP